MPATKKSAKSNATAQYPDMALNLSRVSVLSLTLPTLVGIPISPTECAEAIASALSNGEKGVSDEDIVIPACLKFVGRVSQNIIRDGANKKVKAAAEAASAARRDGTLALALRTQFYAVTTPAAAPEPKEADSDSEESPKLSQLEAAIEASNLAGLPGQRLAFAVLLSESHRNMGLVYRHANAMAPKYPHHNVEDLIGFGWDGLRIALLRYEPSRGFAFSTFASYKIKGQIQSGVRSEDRMRKRLLTYSHKVDRVRESLVQDLNRFPNLDEIQAALDSEVERKLAEEYGRAPTLEELKKNIDDPDKLTTLHYARRAPASLEEMSWTTADGSSREVNISLQMDGSRVDTSGADAEAETSVIREAITAAMTQLTEEEATAVQLLILENRPMKEVKKIMDKDPRRLRALRTKGMAKLADLLSEWNTEEALTGV